MNSSAPPLRVLQVNSLFSGGGTDNQTLELAAGLAEGGDDVTLAIAAHSRWEPLARQLAGVRVTTFDRQSPLKWDLIHTLVRTIRAQRIQIVHAHQGRDYWPAILAARLAGGGARIVVTRHLMTRPRTLSRWGLLRAADVIAVSQAVQRVLEAELRGPRRRLHQIYGGIEVRRFAVERTAQAADLRQAQGWPATAVVFGVVGAYNLPRGKGQLEFLEAAAQMQREFPEARFAIIGSGTMEAMLRERMASLHLERVVSLIPFTDDIPLAMNALDVLVHPALGTEALGLVLWEAMACGRPVIASRLDGIPEAFLEGEHGLLVPPEEVAALAQAMRLLAADAARRELMGRAGRAHVEQRFTRPRLARRTRDLYRSLIA